jgi:hypothetical protein
MPTLDNMDRARVERLGALTAHVVEHALAERRLESGMTQSADVLRAWLG